MEKALCIQERVYGPEHRVVATILTNLGNAYGDLGDPQMKRDLLAEALHIQGREYETEHRQLHLLKRSSPSLEDHQRHRLVDQAQERK